MSISEEILYIDKNSGFAVSKPGKVCVTTKIKTVRIVKIRYADYEDVNDAERLSIDPAMRAITGKKQSGRMRQVPIRQGVSKLIKIGAKVVKHSGYVTFQKAEVTIS